MGESIVEEWLRSLNLVHYTQAFFDNGYDDLEVCKQIGDPDLDAIGVEKPAHRKEILDAVKILREQGGTAVYFTLENPDYLEPTGLYRDYYVTERESEDGDTPKVEGVPPTPTPRLDGYSEGKKALLIFPKLQLTAIIRDKLVEDDILLTEKPYTCEEGGLDKEKAQELAEKYAGDLKTHVRDVSERLEELHAMATCPDDQSPEKENGRESPTKNMYGMFSIYGQSSRSVPPPLPARPPPSSTYADPVDLEQSINRASPVKSPRHASSQGSGNVDNASAGSEASNPTESSTVSEGASEGADRERDNDSPGRKSSSAGSVFQRLFKLTRSGRKYAYKAQPGEIHASEITMSNQELADILIKVKEGKLNQDDAVREVKRYELEKREKDSLSTGSQSSESSMLSSPQSSPRVFFPARRAPTDLFLASGFKQAPSHPSQPSPSLSKKSKASPFNVLKALFSGGKLPSGQAREDPAARNYFDSAHSGSPARTKRESPKRMFSSPAASPSGPRKSSTPEVGSPRHKGKFFTGLFTRRASGDSKSSESMKLSSKSDTASVSKRGSDSESVSSSGIPSPRRGVNASVSQPLGMAEQETRDLQRSISEGATLPAQPRHGATESPSTGSPDVARRKGPLPDLPRQVIQPGTFDNHDDYAPAFYEITADVHSNGEGRGRPERSQQSCIRDQVKNKNIKNGTKSMQIKGDIDIEGEGDRAGRSPKRRTTPPDSQSPKRQHISPDSRQVSSPNQTLIDIPEGHNAEKEADILRGTKDSAESPDPGIEVSPTSTLDSVDMKDSKYGSASSTMSIGSEGSPTLGRQKGKVIREKSKLRRHPGNSASTEDETMSSDHDEVGSPGGYPGCDIVVSQHELRAPLPPFEEQQKPFARDSDERSSITEVKKDERKRRIGRKEHSKEPKSLAEGDAAGFHQASSSSSRSSISVEEEAGGKLPYVAVARANTDSSESPYDTEALSFKKGDIIYIISKNKSGLWRGMVNDRVGDIKFIHVDLLPEFPEKPLKKTKSTFVRRSYRRPKPKTVEELLKRLGLPHVLNKFLLHGFETLELFSTLEESDLDNLEINDPEERTKLLTVASLLGDDSILDSPDHSASGGDCSGGTSGHSTSQSPINVSSCDSPHHITMTAISKNLLLANGERDRGDGQEQSLRQACDIESCDQLCTTSGDTRQSPPNSCGKVEKFIDLPQEDQEIISITQNGEITISCLGDGSVYETPHITTSTSSELDKREFSLSTSGESSSSKHSGDSTPPCQRTDSATDKVSGRSRHSRDLSDTSHRCHSPKRSQVPTYVGTPTRSASQKSTSRKSQPPESSSVISLDDTSGSYILSQGLLRDASTQHGRKLPKYSTFSPRRASYTSDNQVVSTSPHRASYTGDGQVANASPHRPVYNSEGQLAYPSPQRASYTREGLLVNASPISSPKIKTAHVRQLSSRVAGTSLVTFAPDTPPHSPTGRSRLPMSTGSPTGEVARRLSPARVLSRRRSRPLSASLEAWVAARLESEGIDLTDPPYTDLQGHCGIPSALVQRYAEETQRDVYEIAQALEEWRLRELQNRGKSGVPNDYLGDLCLSPVAETPPVSLPEFLTSIGLPMYLQSLVCNNYRTLDDLKSAEEENLKNCGITDNGHIRRLLSALVVLQGQGVKGQGQTPTHRSQRVTAKVSKVVDKV